MVRRLVASLAVLWIAATMAFIALRILPGNPAELVLGTQASPDQLQTLEQAMGLNHPLWVQYVDWLGRLLHGDLGESRIYSQSVTSLIAATFPVTFALTTLAAVFTLLLAVPAGLVSAWRRGGVVDRVVQFFVQFGLAVPSFWLGILLMLMFAVRVQWFPPGGYTDIFLHFGPGFASLVLPAVAIAIPEASMLARMVKSAAMDVLAEDYIRSARAKGLRTWRILFRHTLSNAALPPLTLFGLQIAGLLAGAVAVENIFSLPGMGRLLLLAISQRDLDLVQGLTVFVAGLVVLTNFLVDVASAILDPRIRPEREGAAVP